VWDQTFSVGSEVLDSQHRELITLLNDLINADLSFGIAKHCLSIQT
jgi:hemerythrin